MVDKPSQHLSDSERGHYEKSIGKLQQASSLEKFLLWVIAFIGVAILIISVQSARHSAREAELAQRRNEQLLQQLQSSSDEINRHLDCIVVFFTNPDRAELSIQDIDSCVIKDGQVVIPNPGIRPNLQVQVIPIPSGQSSNGQPQTQPSQPRSPEQPTQPSEQHPREIFGIPVCVPLTDVCWRR